MLLSLLLSLLWTGDVVVLVLVQGAFAPLLLDHVQIRTDVPGLPRPGPRSWADSYSYNNSCYCNTTFDHNLATIMVMTPMGNLTVRDICTLLGTGPTGTNIGRPLYNDIQCGNGPSVVSDEVDCPGRTEYGQEGCKYIGPKWNFVPFQTTTTTTRPPTSRPRPTSTAAPTIVPKLVPTKTPTVVPVRQPMIVPVVGTTATPITTTPTIVVRPTSSSTTTTPTTNKTTTIGIVQWIMQQLTAILNFLF